MRFKAVVLALALAGVTAAAAAAEGGPGPGSRSGPPPGGTEPQGRGDFGSGEGGDRRGAKAERAFRDQLTALGYTCLRRPVLMRGSLTATGADSLTVHPLRARERSRTVSATDVTARVLSTTQIRRRGPATVASLVVGDLVELRAVACRTTGAASGTPPTLVARLVKARPAHA